MRDTDDRLSADNPAGPSGACSLRSFLRDLCGRLDPGAGRGCQYFSHSCPADRADQRLKRGGYRDRPWKNDRKPAAFLYAVTVQNISEMKNQTMQTCLQ